MTIGLPFRPRSWPAEDHSRPCRTYALIRPLPKFATSSFPPARARRERDPTARSGRPSARRARRACRRGRTRRRSRPSARRSRSRARGDAYVTNTRPPTTRMPNGAYHAGIFGSTNAPRRDDAPPVLVEDDDAPVVEVGRVEPVRAAERAIASPRKIAPFAPSSTATTASADQPCGTVGDQPRIVPSSHA